MLVVLQDGSRKHFGRHSTSRGVHSTVRLGTVHITTFVPVLTYTVERRREGEDEKGSNTVLQREDKLLKVRNSEASTTSSLASCMKQADASHGQVNWMLLLARSFAATMHLFNVVEGCGFCCCYSSQHQPIVVVGRAETLR
jgi:hypothetical protein